MLVSGLDQVWLLVLSGETLHLWGHLLFMTPAFCRTLVSNFEASGLSVAVAVDSSLYQTQVFAASHGDANSRSPRRQHTKTWGDRPVLLLLGIRLGIEGVNPIYYETIKVIILYLSARYILSRPDVASLSISSIRGHRWWSPELIILLRWLSGG